MLRPHLLCIGGEDHCLRIPFLIALRGKGFRISAAAPGDPSPFARAGLDYHPVNFARFVNPLSDWAALKTISKLIADLRPLLVQCFDTKLNVLVPLAARGFRDVGVVSTINGLGWLYSSRSPMALGLRPVHRVLHRLTARSTAVTVFQNRDDQAFFMRHQIVGTGANLVIPSSGIDIERFEQAVATGPSPAELRHALGLGTSEVVITVTRITRQKGSRRCLEAAALVHQARPGVRFLLVGPRESEGRLAVRQAQNPPPCALRAGHRSAIRCTGVAWHRGRVRASDRIARGGATCAPRGCRGRPSDRGDANAGLYRCHSRRLEWLSRSAACTSTPGREDSRPASRSRDCGRDGRPRREVREPGVQSRDHRCALCNGV